MNKIRIAFIKFGGLSAGGTERWLQIMAVNLPKDKFLIDYYYCDAAPYLGSDYKHQDTDVDRKKYMEENGVNLIKFSVGYKNITIPDHEWVKTDFWEVFDFSKYDFVQTAKAGNKEYPYYLINLPIIEFVALSGGIDFSSNIIHSIHPSKWQRNKWLKNGGILEKSSIIPVPVEKSFSVNDLREKLNIPVDAIIAGFHQRPDNNIASDIPLKAFALLENESRHFIIMGGGSFYREQAKKLKLKNIHFLEASANSLRIVSFLKTLDIFAHGRKDGETFGTVFAEAMIYGLPCLSHKSGIADAQGETMGPGGFFAENFEEYVNKLKNYFEDRDLRKKISSLGKDYAFQNYTIPVVVEKLCNIYYKVYEEIENKKILIKNKNDIKIEKLIKNAKKISLINKIKILFYNKYYFKFRNFIKSKIKPF